MLGYYHHTVNSICRNLGHFDQRRQKKHKKITNTNYAQYNTILNTNTQHFLNLIIGTVKYKHVSYVRNVKYPRNFYTISMKIPRLVITSTVINIASSVIHSKENNKDFIKIFEDSKINRNKGILESSARSNEFIQIRGERKMFILFHRILIYLIQA